MTMTREEVMSTLRACLMTTKGGVPLDNVNADYKSLEGVDIPFKQFGFTTLDGFLSTVPRLRQYKKADVMFVEVVPDEKTAHLAELIKHQKSNSKKRPRKMQICPRKPMINNNKVNGVNSRPPARYDSPGNSPRRSPQYKNHQQGRNSPVYPPRMPLRPGSTSPTGKNYQNRQNQSNQADNRQNQSKQPQNHQNQLHNRQNQSNQQQNHPNRQNQSYQQQNHQNQGPNRQNQSNQPQNRQNHSQSRQNQSQNRQNQQNGVPQRTQSPTEVPVFQNSNNNNQKPVRSPPQTPRSPSQPNFSANSLKNGFNLANVVPAEPLNGNFKAAPASPTSSAPVSRPQVTLKAVKPLSQRLKPASEAQDTVEGKKINLSDPKTTEVRQNPVQDLPQGLQGHQNLKNQQNLQNVVDIKDQLRILAKRLNLSEPEYKNVRTAPKAGKSSIFCQVQVGPKHKYSSFPNEAQTEDEAEKLAAAKAIAALQSLQEPPEIKVKVTGDHRLVEKRLLEIVDAHPTGIFMEQLPGCYKEKYEEILPGDWIKIVDKCRLLTTEKGVGNLVIICKVNVGTQKANSPVSSPERPFTTPATTIIAPLTLPTDDLWPVYVSHVTSTCEVWVRLLEDEYNEKFFLLSQQLSQSYSKVTTPASTVEVQNYYAIKVNEETQRVRVEALDPLTGDAEVFFIDTGDVDVVSCEKLFALEKTFSQLPPQAIRVCLSTLEEIAVCETTTEIAEKLLLDKTFYLQTVNRAEDETSHVVVGVFYDTEGDVDVNVNQRIGVELQQIMELSQPDVQLTIRGRVLEVYVSHIENEVYLQVQNDGMLILTSMLNNLLDSAIDDEQVIRRAQVSGQLDPLEIYLAQRPDNNWVRVQVPFPRASPLQMRMIDFGGVFEVDRSKLLRLKDLSEALARFPPQSIKVELQNIGRNRFDQRMALRLRELAPLGEKLLCKVIQVPAYGRPAVVELFKRTQPDNLLISINNTLDLEPELMKAGDGNNNIKNRKRLVRRGSKGSDEGVKALKKPFIPGVGDYFNVHVTQLVANPGNFIVQPHDDKPKLEVMMRNLQEAYKTTDGPQFSIDMLSKGRVCAARNNDGYWYRACINRVVDEQTVAVHFCDFGDINVVPVGQLQPLKKEFLDLPYQAIKARLVGIQPINGDWSLQTCIRFQKLVVNKSFVSVVKHLDQGESTNHTEVTLGLELIDVSLKDRDIYIHQVLIDEKRVVPEAR